MSCRYYEECPSKSGWCTGSGSEPSEKCVEFLITAYQNLKEKGSIKPPIGIKPRWVWERERLVSLEEATQRYVAAGFTVPPEWFEEFIELKRKLEC